MATSGVREDQAKVSEGCSPVKAVGEVASSLQEGVSSPPEPAGPGGDLHQEESVEMLEETGGVSHVGSIQ